MQQPFEVSFSDVETDIEVYVDSVFASLRSEFLTLPKGEGFVEYPIFEAGHEALKRKTGNFRRLESDAIFDLVRSTPIVLIVLRAILGFTQPEWAYVTTEQANVEVPQGAARTLDRNIRLNPTKAASSRWRRHRETHASHDRYSLPLARRRSA